MNNKTNKILAAIVIAVFGIILYLFARINGWGEGILSGDIESGATYGNLFGVFIAGLFVGGLSCLAVQGGLLAATIAQREEEDLKEKAKTGHALPILSFLGSKLVAYTILGFLLGWFGSLFELSITTRVIMQAAVVIFMLGTALNLLDVHPIFRYFVIQPPKFLTRMVRKESKSKNLFAPAILGAFTVFIPCGVTQGMMALAIASGSPILGALILLAFTLGTSPMFFGLGYFATRLGESTHKKFMKFAAIGIIVLALYNLNSTIALTGSSWTLSGMFSGSEKPEKAAPAVTTQTIEFGTGNYNPDNITVKAGSKVTLNLVNKDGYGCIQAFTIPALNYQKIIPVGSGETVEFTAPDEPGEIAFMCSMGMYRGVINVI